VSGGAVVDVELLKPLDAALADPWLPTRSVISLPLIGCCRSVSS
jgi:hypothetical protein